MKKKAFFPLVGMFTILFLFSFFTMAVAKPIELKVSSWTPSQLPIAKLTEEWGKK